MHLKTNKKNISQESISEVKKTYSFKGALARAATPRTITLFVPPGQKNPGYAHGRTPLDAGLVYSRPECHEES